MQKIAIIIIIVLIVVIGTNSAFAITCNGDQTIVYNEELGEKECIGGTSINDVKKKKSDSKPYNYDGFTFGGLDSRKHPTWVNWIPATPMNKTIIPVMDQKMANDKVGSHGYDRDHYLFSAIMKLQEDNAKKLFKNFQNEDFDKLDNFKTIIGKSLQRSEDPELQKNLEIQKQISTKILENLMNSRNTRY